MKCQHLTILTGACENCGCAYRYCPTCQAQEEYEDPQESCQNAHCGCHTDTRKEL